MPVWQEVLAGRNESNVADWQDVMKATLPNWIGSWTNKSAPPIFRLRLPETSGADQAWHSPEDGTEMRRRVDSGILELRLRQSALEDASSLHEWLLHTAAHEDDREFRQKRTNSQVIVAEFESWLPRIALPVIGPGGRIIVSAEAGAATADIVVRRRHDTIPSQWRAREELLESMHRRIAERAAGHVVASALATFGYFELSKYERQQWLRPAFLLSIRIVFADDERVEWGDTIVEPATTAEGIGPTHGLGSWAE